MTHGRKALWLAVLASATLLILLPLAWWWWINVIPTASIPTPAVPVPNALDEFERAGSMVAADRVFDAYNRTRKPLPDEAPRPSLAEAEAALAQNVAPLERARRGL